MLVVSECGYPEYLVSYANRILDEQPDMPVYVLHDSTYERMQMAERLFDSDVFDLFGRPITDLGLRPGEVKKMRRLKKFGSTGAVEVDYLRWGKLSGGTTAAIAGGISFAQVMDTDSAAFEMSFG
jgi:hypothetical protein